MTIKINVEFYEKPGCINNTKQKNILMDKGYELELFNILTEKWEKDDLLKFIAERPVHECFNMSAPSIKKGEVDIKTFTTHEAAAEAMMKDPYLIKRPLIKCGGRYGCGFDSSLATDLVNGLDVSALLTCPKMAEETSCDEE